MTTPSEKFFDIRTRGYYLKKGLIDKKDLEAYTKGLQNDEDNFDLYTFEEDEPDTDLALSSLENS